MTKEINLKNVKKHKFLVLEKIGRLKISGIYRNYWTCICDCGKTFNARADHIIHDRIKSCGCYRARIGNRTAYNIKPKGLAAAKIIFNSYRNNAKRRNVIFEIIFEDFLKISKENCFYCGYPPLQESNGFFKKGLRVASKKVNGSYFYNGMDRIIPNNGYVLSNLRPCCKKCNVAKLNQTIDEFDSWAKRFIEHYGKYLNN